MSADIKAYIQSCKPCIENVPVKIIKAPKMIIAEGPLDRITGYLWEIPEEMRKVSNNRYRYVLTCIDHFSKYKWKELISEKEGSIIAKKFEYIFNFFRPPNILQTDNGKEFVNNAVKELCDRINIKFIHGSPYHPQSQGVVEKINDFIAQKDN